MTGVRLLKIFLICVQ